MRKKIQSFFKSPLGLGVFFALMIAVMVLIVVFSTKAEQIIQQQPNPGTNDRPGQGVSSSRPVETTPPSEETVYYDSGNDDDAMKKAGGLYDNSQTKTVQLGYGMLFSVGLGQANVNDAIYLNPHFTYEYAGNAYEKYCYLMKSDRVSLEYSSKNPGNAISTENDMVYDFALRGRTYDKVVPAVYSSIKDYGVKWADSSGYGGAEHDGDAIQVLIIRISDGTLMGAARIDIAYSSKDNTYKIASLQNGDVSVTRDLSNEQREELIETAIEFWVKGNDRLAPGVQREELEETKPFAVVTHPGRVYYGRLFNMGGDTIAAGSLSHCDIYAVNLNCNGLGFLTVYFAPEPQANGLRVERISESDPLTLTPVGYDAFAPFTASSFNAFLDSDEIEFFNTALN